MPVTELSKDQLEDLWKSGIPLDHAWVAFARFFDSTALQALRTHPNNDPDPARVHDPRYLELIKGWLPTTWEARLLKLAAITESERGNLLGELYDGRLWAIGCRTLPSGFDEPVRIPRRLFLA